MSPISQTDLLNELDRLAAETDQSPTVTALREQGKYSLPTYRDRFGSWNDAKKEAGYSIVRKYNGDFTREGCIQALCDIASHVNGKLTIEEYQNLRQNGKHPDYSVLYRKFGSWNQAKKQAGIQTIPSGGVPDATREECLDAIENVAEQVDGTLSAAVYDEQKPVAFPGSRTVRTHFESWNGAKQVAGITEVYKAPQDRKYTTEECIQALQEVDGQTQKYLTREVYSTCREDEHPSTGTIEDRCGNWSNGKEQADLSTSPPSSDRSDRFYGPNWEEVKRRIHQRDNHECQNCATTQEEHLKKYYMSLPVHHVIAREQFKLDYETANHNSNLVTLCTECHPKFNWLSIEEQCEQLNISQPQVSPPLTDFDQETDPIAYWISKAATEVEVPTKSFRPVHYHQYIDKIDTDNPPTLTDIFPENSWNSIIKRIGLRPIPDAYIHPDKCIDVVQTVAEKIDGEPSWSDYDQNAPDDAPGPGGIAHAFGTWYRAKQASDVVIHTPDSDKNRKPSSQTPPKYSREDCIDAIQTAATQTDGKLTTKKYQATKSDDAPSISPIKRVFGTWTEAVDAAGLEQNPYTQWTPSELINLLQHYHTETDGKLTLETYQRISEENDPSVRPFRRAFETWTNALDRADLPHDHPHGYWTKERIQDRLETASDSIQGYLSQSEYRDLSGDYPAIQTVKETFGSWADALESIGMGAYEPDQERYTTQNYFAALKQANEEHPGSRLTTTAYEELKTDEMPSSSAIAQSFGTWGVALQKAGLESSPKDDNESSEPVAVHLQQDNVPTLPYKDNECLEALQEFAEKLGRPPARPEYELSEFVPDSSTISRRFEGWPNAKEAAGLESGDVTEEKCIKALQEVEENIDGDLTAANYRKYRNEETPILPSASSIEHTFDGSWNAAKEAAGITLIRRSSYTESECREALRRVADTLEESPTKEEYNNHRRESEPSPDAIIPHWDGSWVKALEAVGLDGSTRSGARYTDDECIAALQEASEELGDEFTFTQYTKHVGDNGPTQTVFDNLFGGFNAAKQEANLKVGKRQNIPREECVEALNKVVRQLQEPPTQKEYNQLREEGEPSVSTVKKKVGDGTWSGVKDFVDVSEVLSQEQPGELSQASLVEFTAD